METTVNTTHFKKLSPSILIMFEKNFDDIK